MSRLPSFCIVCSLARQCTMGLSVWDVAIGAFWRTKLQVWLWAQYWSDISIIIDASLSPKSPVYLLTYIYTWLVGCHGPIFISAKNLHLKVFIWKRPYCRAVWSVTSFWNNAIEWRLLVFPLQSAYITSEWTEDVHRGGRTRSGSGKQCLTMFSLQVEFTAHYYKSYIPPL